MVFGIWVLTLPPSAHLAFCLRQAKAKPKTANTTKAKSTTGKSTTGKQKRNAKTLKRSAPVSAGHSTGFSLPTPTYAHDPYPSQKEKPIRRIHKIIYPTLGFPALSTHDGRFSIWLYTNVSTGTPSDWRVSLKTKWSGRGGQTFDLSVIDIKREGRIINLTVEVPIEVPREHFHLSVKGPGSLKDRQPRAVRVLGSLSGDLRFVAMSDHQLWDPSWKVKNRALNSTTYPKRGQTELNKAMTYQIIKEMELLDPDFIIYTGDFLFGLNYRKEYEEMWSWWHQNRLTTFMVPGNHDAYANYEIRIRGNLPSIGRGILACTNIFPRTRDWWRIWRYLVCVYDDVKNILFDNLIHDGLVSWKQTFGPPYYSFDIGPYHFVGLNTYDGTNKRRHAFAIWMPIKNIKLGAPAVDNYGGYLSEKQMRWLKTDLKGAQARGKTIVFFGHHDPRGNRKGERCHANDPFPTDPVGIGHFEEWNYDSENWDSNPTDSRYLETPQNNSGTRLLELVARYGSYYISGHVHEDEQTSYRKGETILGHIRAKQDLTFAKVTTATSSIKDSGYWGYRLFKADATGKIQTRPFLENPKLLSIPAGNFWKKSTKADKGPTTTIYSGLPRSLRVALRYRLKFRPKTGYRFHVTQGVRPDGEESELRVREVSPDTRGPLATYFVEAYTPRYLGHFPPHRLGEAFTTIETDIAKSNRPPVPGVILITQTTHGKKSSPLVAERRATVPVGTRIVLDGSQTKDPEGKRLGEIFWKVRLIKVIKGTISDGKGATQATKVHQESASEASRTNRRGESKKANLSRDIRVLHTARGRRIEFRAEDEGIYEITINAFDKHGALGTKRFFIESHIPQPPRLSARCGCCVSSGSTLWFGGGGIIALILGVIGAFTIWKRRRKTR